MSPLGVLSIVFAGIGAWGGWTAMRLAPTKEFFRIAAGATFISVFVLTEPFAMMILALVRQTLARAFNIGT
jgi:hypothetical protein